MKSQFHSGTLSDAVVGSLLGYEAHGVVPPGGRELTHVGPPVPLGIIFQHLFKVSTIPFITPCNM